MIPAVDSVEPRDLPSRRIKELLLSSWQLEVDRVAYARLGHGSYHWICERGGARAWFVTADRLTEDRLAELDGSARLAYTLSRSGHEYVVAPIPDRDGALIHSGVPGWAVQVTPHIAGNSTDHGASTEAGWSDPVEQRNIARVIGRLHAFPAPDYVPRWNPTPPYRAELEAALGRIEDSTATTHFVAQTRALLREQRQFLAGLVDRYDGLVAAIQSDADPWVLTHGEPDSDNVIRTDDGALLLIDWTTAAIAPRERDLYDVFQGPSDVLHDYQLTAGNHQPRTHAMEMIGLHWRLSHVGHDLALLLSGAGAADVSERAWTRLLQRLDRPPGAYAARF